MNMIDFVKNCEPGFYREINTTAHNLNDEIRRQGIKRKRFVELENGVACEVLVSRWITNRADF